MNFFCQKKTFSISGKSQELLEIIRNNSSVIINRKFCIRQLTSNTIELIPNKHFSLQRSGSVPNILLSFYMSEEELTFDVVCKLSKKYLVFDLIISFILSVFEIAIIYRVFSEDMFEWLYIVPIMIPLILILFINVFLKLSLKYYSRRIFDFYQLLIANTERR